MLLSDLLAVALFLFIVWHQFREGYAKRETPCKLAKTQEDCVASTGGTKNVCYWCAKKGTCINGDNFPRGRSPPGCSSNYA